MTDAAQWPPPSGPFDAPDRDVAAPAPPAPPVAWSPVAPGQQWAPGSGPAPGWTPPPKPGLVPLRPLGFGTLLGAPFQVLRRSPRTTLGVALLVQGVGSVLALALYGVVAVLAVGRVEQADAADQDAVGAGALAIVILAALIPLAVALATGALVQGVVVLEVSRGVLGERPTLRQLLGRLRGRFWALIVWTVLQGVGTALLVLAALALAVPLFLLGAQNGGAGTIVGGVLVLVFAGLAAAALGVWIGTKLALVPSILVVERLSIRRSIARSWSLVVGGFWRTFGALALMLVIVQLASQVIATPFSLLVPIGGALIAPTDPNAQIVSSLIVAVLSVALGLVIGAVGTVLQSAVTGLVYLDRRMRREGFDLVLLRHVEDRAAGRSTVDPFPAPERAPR
ncbi:MULTISPECIES: hypothetical protein [unclassified Rathayibacter]|uniref:hypothetical protein n=1 Tax=unclassified Rathayibacter TaxID=2609250 RepID=UPI0006FA639A|nr:MULTISPECIES: hypothetical protein [unclassified Rathayibacter]KQP97570.1 hypothetical protein ASF42_17995 [Rathayibacter sp. Leaf294]KQS07242.1 hypothetical protein ASG06_18730 [Rathayibacter sp. Leaf185]